MSDKKKIIGNKNNVKKQHIIPNFLLKEFSDNNQVFQFDIKKWKSKKEFYKVRNTDSLTRYKFYDTLSTEGEEVSSEDILALIENKSAPIISTILKKGTLDDINDKKFKDLLAFIVSLFLRTSVIKNSLLKKKDFLEVFKKINIEFPKDLFKKLSSEKIDYQKLTQHYFITNIEYFLNEININSFHLKKYRGHLFVSDNPVILDDPTDGLENGILYFPISTHYLLIAFPFKRGKEIELNMPSLKELNIRQIQNSENFIWTKKNKEEYLLKLLSKIKGLDCVPRIPFKFSEDL